MARDYPRVQTVVEGESMTKQSEMAACDINNIMKKYQTSGALAHMSAHQAEYMDVDPVDFTMAQNIVADARSMFASLPSSLRARFKNRPEMYLEFVQDPANLDEMVKLGLAEKRVVEPVVVAAPAAAPAVVPATPVLS